MNASIWNSKFFDAWCNLSAKEGGEPFNPEPATEIPPVHAQSDSPFAAAQSGAPLDAVPSMAHHVTAQHRVVVGDRVVHADTPFLLGAPVMYGTVWQVCGGVCTVVWDNDTWDVYAPSVLVAVLRLAHTPVLVTSWFTPMHVLRALCPSFTIRRDKFAALSAS